MKASKDQALKEIDAVKGKLYALEHAVREDGLAEMSLGLLVNLWLPGARRQLDGALELCRSADRPGGGS